MAPNRENGHKGDEEKDRKDECQHVFDSPFGLGPRAECRVCKDRSVNAFDPVHRRTIAFGEKTLTCEDLTAVCEKMFRLTQSHRFRKVG